ncbi:trace amine-associated receptor 13c-like [Thalassophryne amazonica]|uniref:trace amine-associated receptor 13c-like n=1 Tax=Thalassophryne amazonica TaxID=390379 RepID=UPI00147245B6|nr:trace amine-associated receptor 13c-like [Thalassophryne amazonica]
METQDRAELCFPQLLNTSCRKLSHPRTEVLLIQILMSSVSVLTVTLNLLVIISVSHFRQLHVPSNLLLLSLAVADFLVGLVVMPFETLRHSECWFLGPLMCSFSLFVTITATSASIGDMVLIAVDRYVAVCHPLHYSTRVTVRRVQICIFLCWICSVLYNTLFLGAGLVQTSSHDSCQGQCEINTFIVGIVDIVISLFLPIAVIVVLYVRVFVVAVSQARAIRSHVQALTQKPSVNVRTMKSELKAARALGVVVIVFIMCLFPFYGVVLSGNNFLNTPSGFIVHFMYFF